MSAAESSLLEAPLSKEGISEAIWKKREKWLASILEIIENQQSFILLKNCFALPKLQYVLHTSLACSHMEDLGRFDASLAAALAAISNIRFEENYLV